MYKKIFELSPVEIRFDLYGSSNTKAQNAPAFWSRHHHYIEKSYNYSVDKYQYDEIEFELETVCSKRKIIFEKVKIKLDEYIEKLKDAYNLSRNYIFFDVHVSYNNLNESFCDMSCIRQNNVCKNVAQKRPDISAVYIYFDSEKLKAAIEEYEKLNTDVCDVEPASIPSVQIETTKKMLKNKEETCMQFNSAVQNPTNQQFAGFQNPFACMGGLDFKFGPVNDDRIASTMFGVVFRGENGRWYKFDKETEVRTDVTGLTFGNLPMMLFPASRAEVKKGDLILYNNEYYYVKKNKDTKFVLDSASTGIEMKVNPATNILNMEIFTKVFVLMDGTKLKELGGKDLSKNFMLAMMLGGMSQGNENGNAMQSMMPLLLMLKGGDSPFSGLFDKVNEGEGLSLETMLPLMCMTQMGNQTIPGVQPGINSMDPMTMFLLMQQFTSGFSAKKKVGKDKKKKNKCGEAAETKNVGEEPVEESSKEGKEE